MLRLIDNFLNSITMYRLVLYGLSVLAAVSLIFAYLGLLPFTWIQLLITLIIILTVGFVAKLLMHAIFKPIANFESSPITSLIIFFILAPVVSLTDVWITVAATVIAVSSKFLLAIDKKHIFNPAAFGVFLIGLLGFGNSIWWVGSTNLLPFVLVLGILIVRKLRKFHLLWAFLISAIITIIGFNLRNGLSPEQSFVQVFLSWPIIFFGTVMLTEPLTSPHRKKYAVLYGVIVGVLFGSQFHIGPLFSSPEFALLVGNLFAFIISPKYKLFLQLRNKIQLAPSVYEFVFEKVGTLHFLPGQYFEWTVQDNLPDSRGNRRYFTIASSPTEEDLKIGVKVAGDDSSSFKKNLLSLDDKKIVASQLSGDFVMPEDPSERLVFVAGGIGVTPFRSMIKYILDKDEKRDITLFYICSTDQEFVYQDIFSQAEKELGIRVVYVITHKENAPAKWTGETGYLTKEMIERYVSDPMQAHYYLSGPNKMVESYKDLLYAIGIKRTMITTDYFPGF